MSEKIQRGLIAKLKILTDKLRSGGYDDLLVASIHVQLAYFQLLNETETELLNRIKDIEQRLNEMDNSKKHD